MMTRKSQRMRMPRCLAPRSASPAPHRIVAFTDRRENVQIDARPQSGGILIRVQRVVDEKRIRFCAA